jgi:hypothetical protein
MCRLPYFLGEFGPGHVAVESLHQSGLTALQLELTQLRQLLLTQQREETSSILYRARQYDQLTARQQPYHHQLSSSSGVEELALIQLDAGGQVVVAASALEVGQSHLTRNQTKVSCIHIRVVDPDWIRIQ